jgi:putative Flp pilus-assembly TadE/G-like protein
VLAQFVLTVFVLFAMLSLIVDVGFARLTQAQMQTAADGAALEGVRARDNGPLNPASGLPDGFASDCIRRAAANRLVRRVFDDDFDPTNGDPDYQFGAGPIIDLTDGATNLHALAMLSAPDVHSYKPDLQLNQQNRVDGDMVSGRFAYSDDPAPSEDSAYARSDFVENPTAPQPPPTLGACPAPDDPVPDPWPVGSAGGLTTANDSAFLVRMRRSTELRDFENQTEPNIASSGPSIPMLFGRATMIAGDDPSGAYSIRRDGVTVRATSIAEVRPALHIGAAQGGMPGAMPFALLDTFITTVNQGGTAVCVNPITGVINRAPAAPLTCASAPAGAVEVGRFVVNPAAVSTVGQLRPANVARPCSSVPVAGFSGYGSVYSLMANGTNRIIGFSRIALGRTPACPAAAVTPFGATIFRGVSLVAPTNATATLTGAMLQPLAGMTPADVEDLFTRNRMVNYSPVLVPVLAR